MFIYRLENELKLFILWPDSLKSFMRGYDPNGMIVGEVFRTSKKGVTFVILDDLRRESPMEIWVVSEKFLFNCPEQIVELRILLELWTDLDSILSVEESEMYR